MTTSSASAGPASAAVISPAATVTPIFENTLMTHILPVQPEGLLKITFKTWIRLEAEAVGALRNPSLVTSAPHRSVPKGSSSSGPEPPKGGGEASHHSEHDENAERARNA